MCKIKRANGSKFNGRRLPIYLCLPENNNEWECGILRLARSGEGVRSNDRRSGKEGRGVRRSQRSGMWYDWDYKRSWSSGISGRSGIWDWWEEWD